MAKENQEEQQDKGQGFYPFSIHRDEAVLETRERSKNNFSFDLIQDVFGKDEGKRRERGSVGVHHSESVYDSGGLDGEIIAISKNLENSPYLTATLETDNPGNLMPGSFAEIWLYTGKADETISLPYSAIMEEQGTYSVFVQVDEDCYKKKNVVLGGNDGERVEILDGLAEGDKVVTDGGIHLKLAASAGVIPGHTHNH